ncbi:Aminopeptidase N [Frankliniella fusca]|uniref:Aminopeptidase N n=1 Tax=Frankliniella fusca TaxID=407009 RepID=A0AAE1HXS2_9NEOP|nr:Aminopeptidase N [Frankliniella fusca]
MAHPCLLVLALVALAAASPLPLPAPRDLPGEAVFSRKATVGMVAPVAPRTRGPARRHHQAPATPARTAAVDADPEPEDNNPYRLPQALRPFEYDVILTPKLEGDFTFGGLARIWFSAIETTDKIVLHAKQLELGDMFQDINLNILDDEGDPIYFGFIKSMDINTTTEIATLTTDKEMEAGSHFSIEFLSFKGKLNDDMDGFYRSSYIDSATGEKRWLATTQFEPTGARRAFPCWDEPSFKARFNIQINRDPKLTAISNMPLVSSKPRRVPREFEQGYIMDTFDSTLPMSTYLVAFVVSDFPNVTNAEKNFTTWARKDILGGSSISQELGPKALQLLAEFNGVPYSLTKMDQAAIPDFAAGAMENWGLVTYKESYLIEKPTPTPQQVERIATAICHEFGHQWTGDLVTLDWWDHTWLNEGFASFYENFICAMIHPEWNLEDKMLPAFLHEAMESDVRPDQVAMSAPVERNDQIEDRFGVISYEKGGSVLRMFYHAVTPDVFKKGMQRYLSINMFKNTKPEHFFKAMDFVVKQSGLHQIPDGVSFGDVASTWTEQPGFPVLNAVRDYSAGTVSFTQKRFLYAEADPSDDVGQQYYVPLVVRSQANMDFDDFVPQGWLDPGVSTAVLPTAASKDQWVLVNPEQTGYFRVNYDEQNWRILTTALSSTHREDLPPATRAQLVNDATSLARADQLDYTLALPVLETFSGERSVAPWQAALAAYQFLYFRLATTDAFGDLQRMLERITRDAYAEVGYTTEDSDQHEKKYLRSYMTSYACHAGNAQCLSDAAAALKTWLVDPANRVLPDVTSATTLCYGVRGSGKDTFEAMRKLWEAAPAADRSTYLSALGCSKDDALLRGYVGAVRPVSGGGGWRVEVEGEVEGRSQRQCSYCSKDDALLRGLLADAITDKYSFDDGVDIFNNLFNRLENHKVFVDFMKDNADAVAKKFQNNFDVQVIGEIIRDIRTRNELCEYRVWVEAKYMSDKVKWRPLSAAFDAAERELSSWHDKFYASVSAWLASAAGTGTSTTTRPTASTGSTGTMSTGASGSSTTPSTGSTTQKSAAARDALNSALLLFALLVAALR